MYSFSSVCEIKSDIGSHNVLNLAVFHALNVYVLDSICIMWSHTLDLEGVYLIPWAHSVCVWIGVCPHVIICSVCAREHLNRKHDFTLEGRATHNINICSSKVNFNAQRYIIIFYNFLKIIHLLWCSVKAIAMSCNVRQKWGVKNWFCCSSWECKYLGDLGSSHTWFNAQSPFCLLSHAPDHSRP